MSDNDATLSGFNRAITAHHLGTELFLYVRHDADLDGRFKAWDSDNQEYIHVNGWVCTIEEGHDDA